MRKTCTKCGVEKGLGEFHAGRSAKDGLQSWCKVCVKEYQRASRERNSEKVKELDRERARAYRERNPEKRKEQQRAYREQNPEKVKEYDRAWREQNPEKVKEIARAYHERNPEIRKAIYLRRRARKADAPGTATAEQLTDRCAMFGNKCWVCGAPAEAIDHVKPLAAGGSGWPCNLRPICTSCNARKGAKWPLEKVDAERKKAK